MDLLGTFGTIMVGWTALSLLVGVAWSRFMRRQQPSDAAAADDAAREVPPDRAAFAHL